GNLLSVWRECHDAACTDIHLYGSRFDAATKQWGPSVQIDAATDKIRWPQVALSSNGSGIAVWIEGVELQPARVMFSRYNGEDATWSSPSRIDTLGTAADSTVISVDADGDAYIAWAQAWDEPASAKNGHYKIVTIRFDSATSSLSDIASFTDYPGTTDAADVLYPAIASNDAGDTVLTWQERESGVTENQVYSVMLDPLGGQFGSWATPSRRSDPTFAARQPAASVDGQGNAYVVWGQKDGTNKYQGLLARYQSGSLWESAQSFESVDGYTVSWPEIATDRDGNSTITYYSKIATSDYSVYGVRVSSSLAVVENVLATSVLTSPYPSVGVDDSGDATVVWVNGTTVFTSRYELAETSGSWLSPLELSRAGGGSAYAPTVAASRSGLVYSTWFQRDESLDRMDYVFSRFD
ncbi:MAG: hypothetical protein MK135_15975, partial [Polyangiaceae bacterium]|nr:hypothetical protein [Polyangiaceae bacterium]